MVSGKEGERLTGEQSTVNGQKIVIGEKDRSVRAVIEIYDERYEG